MRFPTSYSKRGLSQTQVQRTFRSRHL